MGKKRILTFLYGYLVLVFLEFILRINTVGYFDLRFLYTMLFCIPMSGILLFISFFSHKKLNILLYNLVIIILTAYFCVQCVYFSIFGEFMSISLIKMGGAALTNFGDQIVVGIKESVGSIAQLLVIPVTTIILSCNDLLYFEQAKKRYSAVCILYALAVNTICVFMLNLGGTGAYTVYDAYHSNETSTNNSVQNLGLLVTTRLEGKQLFFGERFDFDSWEGRYALEDIKEYSSKEYNVSDISFEEILNKCESKEAAELTIELANREPTKKNQYTGIFKGYNLITICAESFSPYLIDKELTPTLYKLSTEGFIFNNFYASFESVTTNGEYAYCLGMFPDLSRSKSNNSFMASADNVLPYALGNMFLKNGASTYAYHNFLGAYYSRNITHPNMGYDLFKTPDNGLDIAPTWPSSDYDMMVQSVDDYVRSGEPFHVYYMTFSGHYQYNWANIMCARNKSRVKDLDYPLTVKAYLSSNLELEKAMTYLMKNLEDAGIAEKTVIVLTTDHYPYGLSETEYNSLADTTIDTDFGKYRNSFICWNGGMKKPVVVDDICSTIDILPTLLNLFGMEYDSRLIIGRDALSDCEELAILADQSFITPNYRFKSSTNNLTYSANAVKNESEVEATKQYVKKAFSLSRAILNTNFYQYITEAENG